MPRKADSSQPTTKPVETDKDLDAVFSIPYQELRNFLPPMSEDKWLELKDIALDNALKALLDFTDQLRRHKQLEPNFPVTIGGLITTLEHLIAIFKIERSILEELKEAVKKD